MSSSDISLVVHPVIVRVIGYFILRMAAPVKWTPVSRQKRVEFKMVTDQSAAEWRCPNFCFTLRFFVVNNAF